MCWHEHGAWGIGSHWLRGDRRGPRLQRLPRPSAFRAIARHHCIVSRLVPIVNEMQRTPDRQHLQPQHPQNLTNHANVSTRECSRRGSTPCLRWCFGSARAAWRCCARRGAAAPPSRPATPRSTARTAPRLRQPRKRRCTSGFFLDFRAWPQGAAALTSA